MFYQRYTEKSDNQKWGGATYLFETDQTNIPARQLAVYENGKISKYDTAHPTDADGKLSQSPLFTDIADKKEWQRYKIGERAFEKAWKKPSSVPKDPFQDAIKTLHVAGALTVVLGLGISIAGLVLALLALNDQNLSHSAQQNTFALYIVLGVIPGMILDALGVLLWSAKARMFSLSLKVIIVASLLIFVIPLLILFAGEKGGVSLLGLVAFVFLMKAQRKIVLLGFNTSTQYRLATLAVVVVIVAVGALTLPHIEMQTTAQFTNAKPAKRLVDTSAAKDLATATSLAEAEQALQKFGAQYNIEIEITDITASTSFKSNGAYTQLDEDGFDLPVLKSVGAFFIDEWAKYPTDWVKHSQLRSIKLVKNLTVNKAQMPATADPDSHALYFDVGFLNGSNSFSDSTLTRQVVHETYFSLITYNDFHSYTPADPVWQALNTADFTYGPSAYCKQTENTDDCIGRKHPMAGFVNDHATTSLQEDKSQLYGYLMTATSFRELEKWLTKDAQLTNKTQALIGYITQYSPEMEGDYYTDINP